MNVEGHSRIYVRFLGLILSVLKAEWMESGLKAAVKVDWLNNVLCCIGATVTSPSVCSFTTQLLWYY